MKTHGLGWWFVIVFLILIIVAISYIVCGLLVNPVKASIVQHRVLTADHGALLTACREMLVNKDKYRNDWNGNPNLAEGEKAIDAIKGITPDVPKPIRELKPQFVVIRTDKIEIRLSGPYRQYVFGFKDGVQGSGDKMLTNGLWYVRH
ncbi:MAG: hypothetical protein PHR77_06835 [Kiritimatiellae bacterium]|nr:hypothetical protein [Kiritimatiellia bacterium]MDD5520581.1 hypothetical protein [Kiritimatiellia bacterium]